MTTATATRSPAAPVRVRDRIVVLLVAAILLWAAVAGLGWLLTASGDGAAVLRWDRSVDTWFAEHRTDGWNTLTHYATYAAETMTVVAIGAVVAVGLRVTLHRWREALFILVALAGEVTIFLSVTLVIHRHRPAVVRLDDAPPTSSFPSGHTAAAVTLYVGLAILVCRLSRHTWVRALAVVGAIVLPVAVALARLYRGMHFPTDVLAGALIGLVWLAVCAAVVLRGAP